jgi:hypothetical protein
MVQDRHCGDRNAEASRHWQPTLDLGLSRRVQFQVSQQRRDTRASCVVGN